MKKAIPKNQNRTTLLTIVLFSKFYNVQANLVVEKSRFVIVWWYKGWVSVVGEGVSEQHVEILEGDEYIHYFDCGSTLTHM